MLFELYSGADNRFLLTEEPLSAQDAPGIARAVCREGLFEGRAADGMLVLEGARDGAPRMAIYNADGTRPEACGNGLRCVGWHLARTLPEQRFDVTTDAGLRRTRLVEARDAQASLFVDMGPVQVSRLSPPWPRLPGLLAAFEGNVGNPHCVLHVEDERELDSRELGHSLQTHPSFPAGVNVGLLARRADQWHLRVFERGVGETSACGTGACAAAATVAEQPGELQIQMRGGELRVRLDKERRAELFGQASHHGSVEFKDPRDSSSTWATCSRS